MRFRITVRDSDIELRGYIDGEDKVREVARALQNIAVVVASPADDDYDPFALNHDWPFKDGFR